MTVAASFGLASALSVVVLGDESGYMAGLNQKMKIAAIEAMWDTEPRHASFTVVGLPSVAGRKTEFAVKVPWVARSDRDTLRRHASAGNQSTCGGREGAHRQRAHRV